MDNKWKVANYELSLRLREFGVRQDKSEHKWQQWADGEITLCHRNGVGCNAVSEKHCVAAHDGSELLGVLPRGEYVVRGEDEDTGLDVWVVCDIDGIPRVINDDSAVNAMSERLIWIMENDYTTKEKANERLEIL